MVVILGGSYPGWMSGGECPGWYLSKGVDIVILVSDSPMGSYPGSRSPRIVGEPRLGIYG